MGNSCEEEYNAFLEKVKRTIYVDNLAPQVTEAVMRTAFNQFGYVKSVHFIPVYLEPKNAPQSALVEMANPKQAAGIIEEMGKLPFMILGMPRPVRASTARLEMFDDRPRKPGRKIICRWLDPEEPEFEVAKKLKVAVTRHAAEALTVLEVINFDIFISSAFFRIYHSKLCCVDVGATSRGRETCKPAKGDIEIALQQV